MDKQLATSLDDFIESKLKVGFYQIAIFVLLALIDLSDGGQMAIMSVTLPAIQSEFGLNSGGASLLSSIFFVGTALGSFSVGKFADLYGRCWIIRLALAFQVLNALLFLHCASFAYLVVLRLAYGFSYGFSLPLTTIYITEIVPRAGRGKWIVFINFFVTVGKLYGTLMALLVMESLERGDWRRLLAYSAVLPAAILLGSFVLLRESMRFLLAKKRVGEVRETFNWIVGLNNRFKRSEGAADCQPMSEEDARALERWAERNLEAETAASYRVLLREEWRRITLLVWLIWFNLNFMFFGQLAVLPYFFKGSSKGIGSVLLTTSGELPVIFVTFFLIEHPSFGRKNSILYFSLFSLLFNLLSVVFESSALEPIMFSARFFMKGVFATVYPFTSEVYPTSFRSVGYGLAAAVGRTGACLMPFVVFPCYALHPALVFWVFALNGTLCAAGAWNLPFDTTGRNLDHSEAINAVEMHDFAKSKEKLEAENN